MKMAKTGVLRLLQTEMAKMAKMLQTEMAKTLRLLAWALRYFRAAADGDGWPC